MDQSKAPSCADKYTILFPTVIEIASSPCVPNLCSYCTLELLGTVQLMNNICENMMNYQSSLASFNVINQFQINQSFISYLLISVDWFTLCFNVQILKEQQFRIRGIYVFMWHNIQSDPQQWYQCTCHLARHVLVIIQLSTV